MPKKLRLVLGDQLNHNHSWYRTHDPDVLYVLMEMRQETDYVRHHVQKIVAFFLAMRAFHEVLKKNGHQVLYLTLDDKKNTQSLEKNLQWIKKKYNCDTFEYQKPDEYRLDQQLEEIATSWKNSKSFDTEHFFTTREELKNLFRGKKARIMETFYRTMRVKHNILIEGDSPLGGEWNYDKENRGTYDGAVAIPKNLYFNHPEVGKIFSLLKDVEMIGNIKSFYWAVTREQSLQVLEFFVTECLPHFGTYQDAMVTNQYFLFHSRLSFSLNSKLISPHEVINRAIK